jgi:hypothetical protein
MVKSANKIYIMDGLSPWALSAAAELAEYSPVIFEYSSENFGFEVQQTSDGIWIMVNMPSRGRIAFRSLFSPGLSMEIEKSTSLETGIELTLNGASGQLDTKIWIEDGDIPVLRYTTAITPSHDLVMPFWPRDMIVLDSSSAIKNTTGEIHASQWGTRSGFIYLSIKRPKAGSVFYLQNLTALADYCEQTETSIGDSVGGTWPELGFALPASDKTLKAGKRVIISDALVAFNTQAPQNETAMIQQYLNTLARLYVLLPKPETNYQEWPAILDKGLADLIESPGCWTQVGGQHYLNAYVSDYDTPPEIMVQLAVLLPLLDYVEWSKTELEVMQKIRDGLPAFYDEKLKTIRRWLPAAEDKLKGEEEQKEPDVMDSWYLHHPLLNLSRLALKGDTLAKDLFLNSLDYAIKVAHHFKYKWPVFYKMDTLEVLKAETAEGMGGEKDVPGIYAHVMLQAWELTHEKRFLQEAEKAAKTLEGLGFQVFYQANNTAFSSGALLRLYKITGNELYLNLSYMCLAGIFRNTQLWDCNYGHGKNFPKFFALYPLNDAPYTAVYEEQEVFCALHDYLKHAEDVELLPSVKMLIAEYIRYLIDRAVYYYPTMLPSEMLEEEPKIGEVDPELWIALEDLQDGWLKSGTVGQEVYGAGNAFGILPRHYLQVPGEDFMIYIDYPTAGFNARKDKNIHFSILGDEQLTCRMMMIKKGRAKLPEFTVTATQQGTLKSKTAAAGNIEYCLQGNQKVAITWKH